ncbi:MAG: 1-acyl-sn-glycerol-3-phosphate acyltransferase [Alphaproteobacteria bacterium]|nr:1-acyl-sn-glycerol-3-phosphate acyltransferase [Alphaproteobacteria bacterium]
MRNVIAALKIMLFILISILLIPVQLLVMAFDKGSNAYFLPQQWHKMLCAIFRIKIKCTGRPYTDEQTIYVSNHMSYLDILVLGTALRASFVSKKDVASWPILGFLSRLQQTAFISRSHVDARKEKNALDAMLTEEKSLIIFPEGTSTDGKTVIPFKSSLFSIAFRKKENNIKIQPITLALHNVEGRDVKIQDDYDLYSWHIDMITPLGKHLWRFLYSRGAEIHIYFHTPVDANEYSDRKILAKSCYKTVSNGLTNHRMNNHN